MSNKSVKRILEGMAQGGVSRRCGNSWLVESLIEIAKLQALQIDNLRARIEKLEVNQAPTQAVSTAFTGEWS